MDSGTSLGWLHVGSQPDADHLRNALDDAHDVAYVATAAEPGGTPSDSIVFARLLVNGEDRGAKPSLVPIHDGYSMSPGITAKFVLTRLNLPRLLTPILSFAIDSYPLAAHPSPSITLSRPSTTSDFHPQRCLPRHIVRRIPEPSGEMKHFLAAVSKVEPVGVSQGCRYLNSGTILLWRLLSIRLIDIYLSSSSPTPPGTPKRATLHCAYPDPSSSRCNRLHAPRGSRGVVGQTGGRALHPRAHSERREAGRIRADAAFGPGP